MDNSRLGQEHTTPRNNRSHKTGKDWKWVKDREEELRSISPLFQKLENNSINQPDPQTWKALSQKLSGELESYKAPLFRTVRDQLTATDGRLLHWLWIIIALILLALVAAAVMITLNPAPDVNFETALVPLLRTTQMVVCQDV